MGTAMAMVIPNGYLMVKHSDVGMTISEVVDWCNAVQVRNTWCRLHLQSGQQTSKVSLDDILFIGGGKIARCR